MGDLQVPRARAALPDVPWIFLYREPVAILASEVQRRDEPGAELRRAAERWVTPLDDRLETARRPQQRSGVGC